jgi:cation diffusion facilitator family transporter
MARESHPLDNAMRLSLWGGLLAAVLAAIKIVAGWLGNSFALIADGLESCMDIVYGGAAWAGYRFAKMPADDNHRFGHGKAESLMALAVSLVLLGGAAGIAWASVQEIRHPHLAPAPFTLGVLVAVVLVKELLFRRVKREARSSGSVAVSADAWHHRSDALTSGAAFIGIFLALAGGPGWESADDWAALAACAVIAANGFSILRRSLHEIMDTAPPGETDARVRAIVLTVPGVRGVEKTRLRRSDSTLFIDIHVEVDGSLSVSEGHRIAHEAKDALAAGGIGLVDVDVHIEPAPSFAKAKEGTSRK